MEDSACEFECGGVRISVNGQTDGNSSCYLLCKKGESPAVDDRQSGFNCTLFVRNCLSAVVSIR